MLSTFKLDTGLFKEESIKEERLVLYYVYPERIEQGN